ncbi:MAG: DUF2971 domain-containing protein [Deltaproteobacteria bacterium]|nr:DUF2971 domain-containing protein [Deltaproteobacteria bacterium]
MFKKITESKYVDVLDGTMSMMKMLAPKLQNKMYKVLDDLSGILCLTETKNNLLMWSRYTDSHRDFIIEFNTDNNFFDQRKSETDEIRHIVKVLYQKERPKLILSDIHGYDLYTKKDKVWEYENELQTGIFLKAFYITRNV